MFHQLVELANVREFVHQLFEGSTIIKHVQFRLSLEHAEPLDKGIVASVDELLAFHFVPFCSVGHIGIERDRGDLDRRVALFFKDKTLADALLASVVERYGY